MKKYIHFSFVLFTILTSLSSSAQTDRFQDFKKMKLNYILENTSLTEEEKKAFLPIFENYEDLYHNEVWIKERDLRKGITQAFDTINSNSASNYISRFHEFEMLGMNIKYERNQKMLSSIKPKTVLNILYQERRFDREMFNRIRNRQKKEN